MNKQQLKQQIKEGKEQLDIMLRANIPTALYMFKCAQIKAWENELNGLPYQSKEDLDQLYKSCYKAAFGKN